MRLRICVDLIPKSWPIDDGNGNMRGDLESNQEDAEVVCCARGASIYQKTIHMPALEEILKPCFSCFKAPHRSLPHISINIIICEAR